MTQRTDTATLIEAANYLSGLFMKDLPFGSQLLKIADRLEEQEATIKVLRSELVELAGKAMSQEDTIRHLRVEICNASAAAMGHLGAIKTFREELDLLNKRPKR